MQPLDDLRLQEEAAFSTATGLSAPPAPQRGGRAPWGHRLPLRKSSLQGFPELLPREGRRQGCGTPPSCQVLPDTREGTRLPNACGAGPSRAPHSAPRIQLAALSPSPARLRGLPQAGRESRQRWRGATSILLPLPEHRARCQRGAGGGTEFTQRCWAPPATPTHSPGDPTGTTGTPARASAAPVPAGSSRAMRRAWGTFPSQGSPQPPHGKEPFLGKGPKPPARPPSHVSQGKPDPPLPAHEPSLALASRGIGCSEVFSHLRFPTISDSLAERSNQAQSRREQREHLQAAPRGCLRPREGTGCPPSTQVTPRSPQLLLQPPPFTPCTRGPRRQGPPAPDTPCPGRAWSRLRAGGSPSPAAWPRATRPPLAPCPAGARSARGQQERARGLCEPSC